VTFALTQTWDLFQADAPEAHARGQSGEVPLDTASFILWLEFEHYEAAPGDDPEDDFCNVRIDLPNGEAHALNVWTFKYLQRARQEDERTGEGLNGRYLVGPDLFVARLDRPTMEAVFADLVRTGQFKQEWRVSGQIPPPKG